VAAVEVVSETVSECAAVTSTSPHGELASDRQLVKKQQRISVLPAMIESPPPVLPSPETEQLKNQQLAMVGVAEPELM
jgi:hypothetical protein